MFFWLESWALRACIPVEWSLLLQHGIPILSCYTIYPPIFVRSYFFIIPIIELRDWHLRSLYLPRNMTLTNNLIINRVEFWTFVPQCLSLSASISVQSRVLCPQRSWVYCRIWDSRRDGCEELCLVEYNAVYWWVVLQVSGGWRGTDEVSVTCLIGGVRPSGCIVRRNGTYVERQIWSPWVSRVLLAASQCGTGHSSGQNSQSTGLTRRRRAWLLGTTEPSRGGPRVVTVQLSARYR
jgi:hypothetical protein